MADTPDLCSIDLVICTYNRCEELDRALDTLSRLVPPSRMSWTVTVVDNACTDATPAIVEKHRAARRLPKLRRVFEARPGLTWARRKGVTCTDGEWIAFIDDDNHPDPGWLQAIEGTIARFPLAGGIGGTVAIDWAAAPPPHLPGFGFCYAEQDYGASETSAPNLAGAGMVLRREALIASGWTAGALLEDRIGKRLVSGGDVEIAQRIKASGYELIYSPRAVLRHRIPASRMTDDYFLKVCLGLGASEALIGALVWRGSFRAWLSDAVARLSLKGRWALKRVVKDARRPGGLTSGLGWSALAFGYLTGVLALAVDGHRRRTLLGAAVNGTPAG
jgi:glycosyltransferase involved in cell wall biosynthesis